MGQRPTSGFEHGEVGLRYTQPTGGHLLSPAALQSSLLQAESVHVSNPITNIVIHVCGYWPAHHASRRPRSALRKTTGRTPCSDTSRGACKAHPNLIPLGRRSLPSPRYPKTLRVLILQQKDVVVLPLEGERKPRPFVQTKFNACCSSASRRQGIAMIAQTIEHQGESRRERPGGQQRTLRGHVAEECENVISKKEAV